MVGNAETLTTIAQDATAGTITYRDEDGTDTVLDVAALVAARETVTTLTQSTTDGSYTYTSEDGTTTTFDASQDGDAWGVTGEDQTVTIGRTGRVGIGTNNPDPSAVLDLESSNQGFLLPYVRLTSNYDSSTIPNPAKGLMVYNNDSTGGLPEGLYYNVGTPVNPSWATPIFSAPNYGSVITKVLYSGTEADESRTVTNGVFEFRFRNIAENIPYLPEFRLIAPPIIEPIMATYHIGQYFELNGFEYRNQQRSFTSTDYTEWQNCSVSPTNGQSISERNELYLTLQGYDNVWKVNFSVLNQGSGIKIFSISAERY